MVDLKPSFDIVSKVADLIIGAALGKITDKAKRSDKVIQILKQVGLGPDSPLANDFEGVYAYTLVVYGIDKPKPLIEFFRHQFIKNAFRQSFETRDTSYLEEESENFIDWNPIAKQLLSSDYDPRREIPEFQEQFITAAKLTRTVQEVLVDQTLEGISEDIQVLPTLEDLQTELSPLDQKLDQILEIVAEQGKRKKVVPFILPQLDISNFTGRDDELEFLENQIFGEDGSRVIGIAGVTSTGGMGKSALAFHFAYKHKDKFPDGVIGLRIDSGSVDAVAQRFASYVGIIPESLKDFSAAEIMQSVFQPLRALLIFDNAEEATVKALRPGGNSCAVIVTTRNKGLLRSLDIPETAHLDLEQFDYEETKELLAVLIGKERVEAEEEAIKQIHEDVGGLPLALRIVGGTLNEQPFTPIADYAADLRQAKLDLLNDLDDKDLDVRASFSLSLKFLSNLQINLFACLSVCAPKGFALQTVQDVSEQSSKDVRDGLARLVRLSLLTQGSEVERFVLHPLLFDFAEELAEKRKLYHSAKERHTNYFIEFAAQYRGLQAEKLDVIESEINSLILTAQRLVELDIVNFDFYLALEPFFQARGYWSQALELISSYQELARNIENWSYLVQMLIQQGQFLQIIGKFRDAEKALLDAEKEITKIDDEREQKRLHAMALNSLGGVLQRQGKFDEAVNVFKRSAELEETSGNKRGQAIVLNSLGSVLQRQGNFDEAENAFERSAAIEAELGNKRGQAMVLNSLGGVKQRQGDFEGAVVAIQKSRDILMTIGDERGQAMVLNSLGGVLQRQGKFDEAVDAFQKSAEIEERIGNDRGQAMVLNSLGGVLQRQGKFDEAVDAFQRSAEIGERIEDYRHLAMVLNSLGGVLQRQGKFDEAVDAFQRSYEISERLDDDRSLAMVLNSLGGVLQRQGKFDEAVDAFQRSYELLVKLGDDRGQAMVLNSLGGVLQRQGKFDEAVDAFQRSYELLVKLGDDRGQAMVLNSLGGVLQRQGKFDEAVDAFQRSYELLVKLGDDRGQAMVLNSLGGVLQRQGKFDEAVDAFQRSYEISEKLDDDRSLAMVLNSLGGVLQRQGKFDEAVDAFQRSYEISEKLDDDRSLAMVLNSLGGVLQRQGKFDEAVDAFQRSYELLVKLGDDRGQAMVLNSLGGVLSKQKKYDDANNKYKESIAIGRRLRDKSHLAKVYTSFGKSLLRQNKNDDAIQMLKSGFEFDEKLRNKYGLRIVTPALVDALKAEKRIEEALKICDRALAVAPRDNLLQKIKRQLSQPNEQEQKTGQIKKILNHEKGYLYGFIKTDDGSPDIYFNDRIIDPALLSKLGEGLKVVVEIEVREMGPRAKRIWLKE